MRLVSTLGRNPPADGTVARGEAFGGLEVEDSAETAIWCRGVYFHFAPYVANLPPPRFQFLKKICQVPVVYEPY